MAEECRAASATAHQALRHIEYRICFGIEIIDIEITDIELMATHYNGTDDERRALDAYIKLMRSAAAINAQILPVLQAEFGVTTTQLGVLEALSHLGPMAHCALAGKLLVSASNLTTVLDNLERDGFVRRDRDPNDRRVSISSLTPAGVDHLQSFFPLHVQRLTAAMSGLDADEQIELGRLCRKLGHAATRDTARAGTT
jgi:MarR family transcriptional regulator, 2-MHQ and catechol-resistance regulon repressor